MKIIMQCQLVDNASRIRRTTRVLSLILTVVGLNGCGTHIKPADEPELARLDTGVGTARKPSFSCADPVDTALPPDDRIKPMGDGWVCFEGRARIIDSTTHEVIDTRDMIAQCYRENDQCVASRDNTERTLAKNMVPLQPSTCYSRKTATCFTYYDIMLKEHRYQCHTNAHTCANKRSSIVKHESRVYHHVSACGPWQ